MDKNEREELINDIANAIRSRTTDINLTHEEQTWVRLAIQREAQSIRLRQAIIEKTLSGLLWSMIAGAGLVFLDWAKSHGFKS